MKFSILALAATGAVAIPLPQLPQLGSTPLGAVGDLTKPLGGLVPHAARAIGDAAESVLEPVSNLVEELKVAKRGLGEVGSQLGQTLGSTLKPVTDLTHELEITKRGLGDVGTGLGQELGSTLKPVTDLTHELEITKRGLGEVGTELGQTLGTALKPVTDLTHELEITKRGLGEVGSALGSDLGSTLRPLTDLTHDLEITKRDDLSEAEPLATVGQLAHTITEYPEIHSVVEDLRTVGNKNTARQLLGVDDVPGANGIVNTVQGLGAELNAVPV